MPNHCYQKLKFHYHGSAENRLDAVFAYLTNSEGLIDFQKIIPQPNGIQDPNPNHLSDSERLWCIENWGTKWNAYNVRKMFKEKWKLGFEFSTAWSVPVPIIEKIFSMFPDVDKEYVAADDGGWVAQMWKYDSDTATVEKTDFKDENKDFQSALFCALNTEY